MSIYFILTKYISINSVISSGDRMKTKEQQKNFERLQDKARRKIFLNPLKENLAMQKQDSKIKYIIFDFGGVMVREGLGAARRIYKEKTGVDIEKIWYSDVRPKWKALEKSEIADGDFWKALEQIVKQKDPTFNVDEFKEIMFRNQIYQQEVVKLILQLRAKGYVTALLTNNVKEWIEEWDRKDPLNQYFDVIVSSHEVKEIKPEPRIYQITLERLGAKPEECVFIDDKEKNIETARKLGMKGIVFKTDNQMRRELSELMNENAGLDIPAGLRKKFANESKEANEEMYNAFEFKNVYVNTAWNRTPRKLNSKELELIKKNGKKKHRDYCPGYMWDSGGTTTELVFKYDRRNNIIHAKYEYNDEEGTHLNYFDGGSRETYRAYYDGMTGELIIDIARLPQSMHRKLLKEFKAESEE